MWTPEVEGSTYDRTEVLASAGGVANPLLPSNNAPLPIAALFKRLRREKDPDEFILHLLLDCRLPFAPDGGEKLSWKYEQSMKTRLEGD